MAPCLDCGAQLVRHRRGRPRLRCDRCNRRRQNARARNLPPGTAYDRWNRDSVRAALAAERARLEALQAAARASAQDIAALEALLGRLEQRSRTAAHGSAPRPRTGQASPDASGS